MVKAGRTPWVLLLAVALSAPVAAAHPSEPRDYTIAGSPAALGAAIVTLGPIPIALFEFYAQISGTVMEQAPRGSTPEVIVEPWIAAMYYPFNGDGYATHFTTRPADRVQLDPQAGGVVTFGFPGVGSVRIKLTGSSASPGTFPSRLTTPGGHHGHSWDMATLLGEAKPAEVGGWIKRGGIRYDLESLVLDGELTSWVAQVATGRIQTDLPN